MCTSLRFLSVAHNQLTELPSLQGLDSLFTLDASHNALAACSCDVLPASLRYLDVRAVARCRVLAKQALPLIASRLHQSLRNCCRNIF